MNILHNLRQFIASWGQKPKHHPTGESQCWHFSQQGQRPYQEDYYHADAASGLFLVCDGVGGAAKGEVASRFVAEYIAAAATSGRYDLSQEAEVQELIAEIQQAINQRLTKQPEEEGMATTLALAYLYGQHITLAHIGDSRVYYIQPDTGEFWRTKDHSAVQELVNSGVIAPEDMATHPWRNRITRAIQAGHEGTPVKADIKRITGWQSGDLLFLCTDGVLESYQENEKAMITLLAQVDLPLEERLNSIRERCATYAQDNNTAILVQL